MAICIKHSDDKDYGVTIAIPTYCRTDLLGSAIDSALSQTYDKPYEVIVVDNNPQRNDSTESLMSGYDESNLAYYKNNVNLGMTGNWNEMIALSKGKWVVMLHDDDLLYPDHLTTVMKFISRHNLGEKGSLICPEYNNSSDHRLPDRKPVRRFGYKRLSASDFICGNIIGSPVGICINRRWFTDTVKFESEYYPSIDFAFYVDAARKGALYMMGIILGTQYVATQNASSSPDIWRDFAEKDNLIISEKVTSGDGLISRLRYCIFKAFEKYRMIPAFKRKYGESVTAPEWCAETSRLFYLLYQVKRALIFSRFHLLTEKY